MNVESPSETVGLAVVGLMILDFINDDLRCERRCATRAGDARQGGGCNERRAALVALLNELLADLPAPDYLGLDDVKFIVIVLADLVKIGRVGADLSGNDDFLDDDLEVLWKAVGLGAAGPCCLGFFRLGPDVAGRSRLAHNQFVELQLELGGIELFGTRSEETVLETGDDLVLALDLGMGHCELRLQPSHPLKQGG